MTDRAYTVCELDALRQAVWNRHIWGNSRGPPLGSGSSRSYNAVEVTNRVEAELRTYMIAGLTAEDLFAADGARR